MDRRRVWGARALPPSPLLGASRTGDGKNGAAIVYIRLNTSMIKQKKKKKVPWSLKFG